MKLFYAIALIFCAGIAPTLAAEQPAEPIPIKGEMLDGSRLVLRAAGCSINLPAAGWRWMAYAGNTGQNYLCANTSSNAMYLVAVGQLHGDFTDHQPQSLIENARKKVAARGGKLENDKFEWITLPGVKKCVRVSFTEVEKAGNKTLAVIYIAQTVDQVSLKMQYTGSSATEPEPFSQMAHSLKILSLRP